MVKLYEDWLAEAFVDKYGKNVYAELQQRDLGEYANIIVDLIKTAYAERGGNLEIKNPSDLKNTDLTYWVAKDNDNDPDADVVLGGKKTPAGTKLTILGQDGSKISKIESIKKMIDLMRTRGFYAEMDNDLASKLGLTPIKGEDKIKKVLNKDIKYNPDGTYEREIAGSKHTKVLVGIPKM